MNWRDYAECEGSGDERAITESRDDAEAFIAKFCHHCHVTKECRDYADEMNCSIGVWGGKFRSRL